MLALQVCVPHQAMGTLFAGGDRMVLWGARGNVDTMWNSLFCFPITHRMPDSAVVIWNTAFVVVRVGRRFGGSFDFETRP